MDMIENSTLVKWCARIFLVVAVFIIVWWFFKKRNDYEYSGIKGYKKEHTIFGNIFNNFLGKKKKAKRVNKTEEKCRKIIEKIYNRPFPSRRPDFLKNPMTRKNLELDCFNQDLKIALEYNGQQHYTYTPHFHKSKKNFYSQVHRDDWKRKKCQEMGIRLIEIPYWVTEMDLENYIINELKKKQCL